MSYKVIDVTMALTALTHITIKTNICINTSSNVKGPIQLH